MTGVNGDAIRLHTHAVRDIWFSSTMSLASLSELLATSHRIRYRIGTVLVCQCVVRLLLLHVWRHPVCEKQYAQQGCRV